MPSLLDSSGDKQFTLALLPNEVEILRDWAADYLAGGEFYPVREHAILKIADRFGRVLVVTVVEPEDVRFAGRFAKPA